MMKKKILDRLCTVRIEQCRDKANSSRVTILLRWVNLDSFLSELPDVTAMPPYMALYSCTSYLRDYNYATQKIIASRNL